MGKIKDGAHYFMLRVYYEDTDSGGIVYYASYLRFIERARSELLRLLRGNQWMKEALFVVKRCAGDYLAPAQLGDELTIKTRTHQVRRASLELIQEVYRKDKKLAHFEVTLVCVAQERLRPCAIPQQLSALFESLGK